MKCADQGFVNHARSGKTDRSALVYIDDMSGFFKTVRGENSARRDLDALQGYATSYEAFQIDTEFQLALLFKHVGLDREPKIQTSTVKLTSDDLKQYLVNFNELATALDNHTCLRKQLNSPRPAHFPACNLDKTLEAGARASKRKLPVVLDCHTHVCKPTNCGIAGQKTFGIAERAICGAASKKQKTNKQGKEPVVCMV